MKIMKFHPNFWGKGVVENILLLKCKFPDPKLWVVIEWGFTTVLPQMVHRGFTVQAQSRGGRESANFQLPRQIECGEETWSGTDQFEERYRIEIDR